MSDYEKNQKQLQQLWNEIMSDEDAEPFSGGSSDNYSPPSSEESSDEFSSGDFETPKKDRKKSAKKVIAEKSCANQYALSIPVPINGYGSSEIFCENEAGPSTSHGFPSNQNIRNIEDTIEYVVQQNISSSESEDNQDIGTDSEIQWTDVTGKFLKEFPFAERNVGINPEIYENFYDKRPFAFFQIFFNDSLVTHIVTETNRYAAQSKETTNFPKSRLHHWSDTNKEEIKTFIGILLWMGMCRFPSIAKYWSKNIIYNNQIKKKMSRNRFELLLRTIHFSNNQSTDMQGTDRLHKINALLEMLKERYQYAIIPGEEVCIDETLVPFRGRIIFRQYLRNKRHKFGIKLYKLCLKGGYTYNLSIYCGKDREGDNVPAATKVVLQLMDNLLNKGRTLYTDNFYTSVGLAHQLLEKTTHLVGTLKSNRKLNCKEVAEKKLKKGEVIARESNTGVVQLKWKDKRDVLVQSTKHTVEMKTIRTSRGEEKEKPSIILDYNNSKAFIDLSDQLTAYNTPLRRSLKWYRKLVIELLLGTTIVNAYIIYSQVTQNKIGVTQFKEEILFEMLGLQKETADENTPQPKSHILEHINIRRRCVVCYEKLAQEEGTNVAQRKTPRSMYQCTACERNFCVTCFFQHHKTTLL